MDGVVLSRDVELGDLFDSDVRFLALGRLFY
jgi:hypothetical protein